MHTDWYKRCARLLSKSLTKQIKTIMSFTSAHSEKIWTPFTTSPVCLQNLKKRQLKLSHKCFTRLFVRDRKLQLERGSWYSGHCDIAGLPPSLPGSAFLFQSLPLGPNPWSSWPSCLFLPSGNSFGSRERLGFFFFKICELKSLV